MVLLPVPQWEAGQYELVVDSRLEDLAGNSVARVFDGDLESPADIPDPGPTVRIRFDCR